MQKPSGLLIGLQLQGLIIMELPNFPFLIKSHKRMNERQSDDQFLCRSILSLSHIFGHKAQVHITWPRACYQRYGKEEANGRMIKTLGPAVCVS